MKMLTSQIFNLFNAAWLAIGVCLACVGMFIAFTSYQQYENMGREELYRLQTQARVVGGAMSLQLSGLSQGMTEMVRSVSSPMSAADQSLLTRLLSLFVKTMPAVSHLEIVDGRGVIVASDQQSAAGSRFATNGQFTVPLDRMETNQFYFSNAPRAPNGSLPAVARALVSGDGADRLTAVATLNLGYFEDVLDSVRYRGDVRVSFQVGGKPFFEVPEGPTNEARHLSARHSVVSEGFRPEQPLSVTASADESSVYSLWFARLADYSVLFGMLVVFTLGLLALQQNRQRKFENRDRENTERLRLANEAAEVGVWEYDVTSRQMTWDDNMFKVHGLTRQKYENSTEAWRSSLLTEDVPRAEAFLKSANDVDHTLNSVLRFRSEAGEVRTFRTIAKGFPGKTGECVRIIGIHQDMTQSVQDQRHLRQLNLELKQRTQEAEQASRYKSQFLANISHEIRTPMNVILGLLFILGKSKLDERQQEFVKKAEGAGKFLLTLLNDVLDFSKVEAGKLVLERAPFELEKVLDDLAVILGTMAADKDVEVLFDISPGLPRTVIGDSLRLHQVLLNLGGNAIKFTEKGTVTVGVEAKVQPGEVELRVVVADTGIGIPNEKLTDIFHGFVQAEASTTRRFGGSGLGLSICKFLVEQMGGHLSVESRPGEGSRFSFTAHLGLPAGGVSLLPIQGDHLSGALHVLVVDDNAETRRVLTGMIRAFGWAAEAVEAGVDALVRLVLAAEKAPFNIVLIDESLPHFDAAATAKAIRTLQLSTERPWLVLLESLGHKEVPDDSTSLWDGRTSKPVTPSALINLIRRLISGTFLADSRSAGADELRLAGQRIIVVEDHPVNRLVAQQLLESEGAEVSLASGGAEALKLLEEMASDCILMDLQMPDMDGFETTRKIRARFGDAPFIVAVTANALPSDREACLRARMNNHIGKPLDLERVVQTILAGKGALPLTPDPNPWPGFEFEAALLRLGSDPVLFRRVAEHFLECGQMQLERLPAVRTSANALEAQRVAHTLKGMAATVGASSLAAAASRLETAYRDDGPLLDLDGLPQLWKDSCRKLQFYLSTLDEPSSGEKGTAT